MRRARRTPAISPELKTAQDISSLQATPPGWKTLQTADGGAPLRIIRGSINTTAGTIVAGGGFTVAKTGVGQVTITWATPFSASPTLTATPDTQAASWRTANINTVGGALNTTTVPLGVVNTLTQAAVESIVHFIAIGPA